MVDVLERMDYLGHTVNFKTHRKSYKQKKKIENDKSEWEIFENTHEPIIDKSTFDIVQKIRANRKRPTKMGEMPMFSGILYCADCGKKLSFHRRTLTLNIILCALITVLILITALCTISETWL